ncbi:MAG TPA: hypothetical protein VHR55_03305 [Candidatus Limnocylindria bacterium]|nr:hypothetical protein [Candidatus Limnocylindria bacterium]
MSAGAPIGMLLRRLAAAPVVFAVGETGLAGFVTPSDLNKQPVRVHFYLLLADLEMTMASVARETLDDPRVAVNFLSPRRRAKALGQWNASRKENIDADVLTAFQFSDLVSLVGKAALHGRFGQPTKTKWLRATSGLTRFRDQVMHPTSDFLGTRTIEELIGTEERLRAMLLAVSGSDAPPTVKEEARAQ